MSSIETPYLSADNLRNIPDDSEGHLTAAYVAARAFRAEVDDSSDTNGASNTEPHLPATDDASAGQRQVGSNPSGSSTEGPLQKILPVVKDSPHPPSTLPVEDGTGQRNVYVACLPLSIGAQGFRDLMSQYGVVQSTRLYGDESHPEYSGRGFGFALYTTVAEAANAVKQLNGTQLLGYTVVARISKHSVARNKPRLTTEPVPHVQVGSTHTSGSGTNAQNAPTLGGTSHNSAWLPLVHLSEQPRTTPMVGYPAPHPSTFQMKAGEQLVPPQPMMMPQQMNPVMQYPAYLPPAMFPMAMPMQYVGFPNGGMPPQYAPIYATTAPPPQQQQQQQQPPTGYFSHAGGPPFRTQYGTAPVYYHAAPQPYYYS